MTTTMLTAIGTARASAGCCISTRANVTPSGKTCACCPGGLRQGRSAMGQRCCEHTGLTRWSLGTPEPLD
jgi:hypothetical protein